MMMPKIICRRSAKKKRGEDMEASEKTRITLSGQRSRATADRALVYSAARMMDSGAKDFSRASAMAKVFATDVAMKVTTDAVQVMGGSGYMKEYPVEKMMRDAKILQIYEGTNQVQRNVIALDMIREATKQK